MYPSQNVVNETRILLHINIDCDTMMKRWLIKQYAKLTCLVICYWTELQEKAYRLNHTFSVTYGEKLKIKMLENTRRVFHRL